MRKVRWGSPCGPDKHSARGGGDVRSLASDLASARAFGEEMARAVDSLRAHVHAISTAHEADVVAAKESHEVLVLLSRVGASTIPIRREACVIHICFRSTILVMMAKDSEEGSFLAVSVGFSRPCVSKEAHVQQHTCLCAYAAPRRRCVQPRRIISQSCIDCTPCTRRTLRSLRRSTPKPWTRCVRRQWVLPSTTNRCVCVRVLSVLLEIKRGLW